ncbi:Major intrinsic protein [Penicillium fimorum]|uniref:Major intrinsic protein n=1 Tax=Penicillium fimorum TaxID=1882269 RepID=A0A9X0C848_9EURO|nr:Major intrinsic protein [Penicillium fimorum]
MADSPWLDRMELPSCGWPSSPSFSRAKLLPCVLRSSMVPTKDKLLQNLAKAQRPTENSQRFGLDVDPNDIEQGPIDKSSDPRQMILTGDGISARQSSRISRTSSVRGRPPSAWGLPPDQLSTVQEGDSPNDEPEERSKFGGNQLWNQDLSARLDELLDIPELEKAGYPEDLHPLVQELVEDEVHNSHTTWSVIRTHDREALAEALGMFVQLTMGFCVDLSVTVAKQGNPNTTAWVWGLATMMAIFICGGVSGAHLNPVVTIHSVFIFHAQTRSS